MPPIFLLVPALAMVQPAQAGDPGAARAAPTPALEHVLVLGRREDLVGEAISASEGFVGRDDIADRPLLRTGDLLEFVPGLIATQHSGSGKANQYFLRGFNLDHGTDFATFVDGMPVNMRTHGHGQGWTDLNFLIPEVVQDLAYRKGTYYADVGDFSATGSVRFRVADAVEHGEASLSVGADGYLRGVVVDSAELGSASVLYAAELQAYDGPWTDIDEDVRKSNALLRLSGGVGGGRGHLMLMAYRNTWNGADQVPQRAVDDGVIDAFGSLDTTVGGEASRDSLSAGWHGPRFGGELRLDAYAIRSLLDLFSNFTYALDDPVAGDQFEQYDDRSLFGFSASQQWTSGRHRWRIGAEGRFDDIARVALFRTRERERLSTVRDDTVEEGSLGLFVADEIQLRESLRAYLGARYDRYRFDVDSSDPANSGEATDGIASWKASVAWRPGPTVELYGSFGTGFHSNDARGTTLTVDPVTGEPASRVDALVGSRGFELGMRLQPGRRFQATLAGWSLRLDSELLFVGDAGNTEASRPSRREGVELGMYWYPNERYTASLEGAYTRSRFDDADPVGRRIPGSIPLVVSAGLTAHVADGWQASAQLRHFGAYPLVEDGSITSAGSTMVNLRLGREWRRIGLHLDLLNALDSEDHDVDYFYASRLPGEAVEGVDDVHFHIFPPRSLRFTLSYRF